MKRRSIAVMTCLLLLVASRAHAQQFGVRAGVSGDPDQFYMGVHYETTPLLEHLRFKPNLEVGFGDDTTLIAVNFEFAYDIPLKQSPWNLYVGAGPALNLYNSNDESNAEGGFNILFGAQHSGGLFTELKVGTIDSPDVKFGVGYRFRR
jgi:hypothetical protein